MLYVNPKYLQRSERGTFRDFTRYHTGGNVTYQNRATLSPVVRSRLLAGADVAYQDGAILFYTLTADGERGTTLRDNKREGAANFGAFVTEELDLGEQWTASLGARYDDIRYIFRSFITPQLNDQRSFARVTPKLGVTFRASPTHTFYANLGGGVEAPAGNETDPVGTFGQDTLYGINPLLDPIRSTTVEVGTKQIVWNGTGALRQLSVRRGGVPDQRAERDRSVSRRTLLPHGGRGTAARRGGRARRACGRRSAGRDGAHLLAQHVRDSISSTRCTTTRPRRGSWPTTRGTASSASPTSSGRSRWGSPRPRSAGWRVRLVTQGFGKYYADDANRVTVPGYAILGTTLSLDRPIALGGGVGLQGFVAINNLADRRYLASAFLNPDVVNNVPVAFEPGLRRNLVLSLSLSRTN